MKKSLLFILFASGIIGCENKNAITDIIDPPAPAKTFVKKIDDDFRLEPNTVITVKEGGYAVLAYRGYYPQGPPWWDTRLFRLDSDGDTLWTRNYSNGYWLTCNDIIQTSDNGFLMVGTIDPSYNANELTCMMKVDANGNVLWTKSYDFNRFSYDQTAQSVSMATDNGFFVLASLDVTTAGWEGTAVLRINNQGDTLWTRYFSSYCKTPVGIATIDSSYVFALDEYPNIKVRKVGDNGVLLWEKIYHYPIAEPKVPLGIAESGDGSFVVASRLTGALSYVLKISSSGDSITSNILDLAYGKEIIYSITKTKTGSQSGFIVAGMGDSTAFLAKINSDLAIEWTHTYPDSAGKTWFEDVKKAPDNGIIAAGSIRDSTTYRIYLVKTDGNGEINP